MIFIIFGVVLAEQISNNLTYVLAVAHNVFLHYILAKKKLVKFPRV